MKVGGTKKYGFRKNKRVLIIVPIFKGRKI